MTTLLLELMYVTFDVRGEIKSIAPNPSYHLDKDFTVATFPLNDVEEFLDARKSPFDYYIQRVKKVGGREFKITRKVSDLNYVRTLDNYLSEIKPMARFRDAVIGIENFINEKRIKLSLNPILKIMLDEGTDEEIDNIEKFISTSASSIFFTRKDDPYLHLATITFLPRILFEQEVLQYTYEADLSNASVYTRKIVEGYSYSTNGSN
jgi:hypothetical protein